MTDQQSLDDIAMLLMQYSGISSARGFAANSDRKAWIHFRCCEFTSLKAIASCAVAANVLITVGDPQSRLCYEEKEVKDLPFVLKIGDDNQDGATPTGCQIFGIFLVWNLKESGLVDDEVADRLQRKWNAHPR